MALFTATIVHEDHWGKVHVYVAMMARNAEEVRGRLRDRLGSVLEAAAVVRRGFDCSEPMACALVSDAMADMLSLAAEDPLSSIARGLAFQVEQRFAA